MKHKQKGASSAPPDASQLFHGPLEKISLTAHVAFVFISILVVYLCSAATTVTMEDSGEFLTMARHLGIAHPPGYPLFVLLGHLWSYLPFSTIAWRIHAMDAVFAAGACSFLFLIALHLTRLKSAALLTALLFGLGRMLWSQSVIAEVYALNCFFFLGLMWMALRLQFQVTRPRVLIFAFCAGLSLTNSWPLMGLCTPAFIFFLWPRWRDLARLWWLVVIGLAFGLLPYLFMWWRSSHGLVYAFYGPLETFQDWLNYILRRHYAADDQQAAATILDALRYHLFFWISLSQEFTFLAVPLWAWGLMTMRKQLRWYNQAGLLLTIASTSIFLLGLWRIEYTRMGEEIYEVFLIVPFAMIALLAGLGLQQILSQKKWNHYVIVCGATILIATNLVTHYHENNLHEDSFAGDYARLVLSAMPERAVLLTWGDVDAGPLAYIHECEHVRPDVTVASQFGSIFPERPYLPTRDLSGLTKVHKLIAYVLAKLSEGHRVFATQDLFVSRVMQRLPFATREFGAFVEIVASGDPPTPPPQVLVDAKHFLDQVVRDNRDHWGYLRNTLIQRVCRLMLLSGVDHPALHQQPYCELSLAQRLIQTDHRYAEANQILSPLVAYYRDLPLTDQNDLMTVLTQGRLLWIQELPAPQRLSELERLFTEVMPFVRRYPGCDNIAALQLLEVRSQVPVTLDIAWMKQSFAGCGGRFKDLLDKIK
jgi:hypothetical protein